MARKRRSQFQFTIVELAVLGMSFAATSFLVFLLGFHVGREVAARHGPPDDRVARIPVAGADLEEDSAERDLREVLAAGDSSEPGPARDSKAAVTAPRVGAKPSVPGDDGAASRSSRVVASAPEPAAAGENPDAGAPGADAVAAAEESGPKAGLSYTVQVLATRNRKEAELLTDELKEQGLGAFVAPVEDAGGKWYRVRIGRYDDAKSAREMAERCRQDIGLSQAYVSPL